MIRISLSFLLGALIFQTSRTLPPFYIVVGFPLVAILYFYYPRGRLVYVVIIGFLWSFLFASVKLLPGLAPQLEGNDLKISGTIEEVTTDSSSYSRFVFRPDGFNSTDIVNRIPKKLSLSWYYPRQSVVAHQKCQLKVRLKRHWRYANPGSVDRERQMFLQGIGARGYVREGECQQTLAASSKESFRARLIQNFSRESVAYKNFGLMQALTFGVREDIQHVQWEVLRVTGTTHLLAISGLHLSAICFVVFVLASRLARLSATICERIPAQCFAAIFAMIAASLYAYLAGFSIPTQRALIMVFVGLGAVLLRKPVVQISLLATALLMVLLWNPLSVLHIGFWMSFLAVLFIFIILKSNNGFPKFLTILRIQLYLAAALLPLSMWFFSYGSLIAPIVNLIAIPYVSFLLLPLLLLAQLLFVAGVDISVYIFTFSDLLFEGLWWWLTACAELPFASILYSPTLLGIVAYELGLLMLMQARGLPARFLSLIFLSALFLVREDVVNEDQLRVTVLDVGQGLAVMVETANHTLLYDAGPRFPSGFNTGTAVVLPYMQKRNIDHVDKVIISHNDNDHAGGVHALLNAGVVKKLIVSNQRNRYSMISTDYCREGDEWRWGETQFRILHPPNEWQSNSNNRSCVVQIVHPAGTILLSGDIEAATERRLIAEYGDKLRSELLLVPHHGSSSSSSRRFLARVRPQTAVFSVGYRNRYSFPHAKITSRYQSIGTELVDTIRQGAVTFVFDTRKGMHKEVGYRPRSRQYWNSTWEYSIDAR